MICLWHRGYGDWNIIKTSTHVHPVAERWSRIQWLYSLQRNKTPYLKKRSVLDMTMPCREIRFLTWIKIVLSMTILCREIRLPIPKKECPKYDYPLQRNKTPYPNKRSIPRYDYPFQGNMADSFIAITPRSTLTCSESICFGPIYKSRQITKTTNQVDLFVNSVAHFWN